MIMDPSAFTKILKNIEEASRIVQANATPDDQSKRKEAEEFLMQLRSWHAPFEFCQFVLENVATDDFVRFQVICIFKESIMREWQMTDTSKIEFFWQFFLNYACANSKKLPAYLTNEIFLTVAMMVKRGTFDGKSGETDKLYEIITKMISSGDNEMISLACRILLSICTEYCTAWKSGIGLTWDFHIRAKRNFEQTDLKKIFGLSLQILHGLIVEENAEKVDRKTHISRLLNLALCIFNWNFGSKFLPKRLTYAVEFSPASTLRPPESWRDIFGNSDVLQFFFTMHSKIRLMDDDDLCNTSIQCLVQLASLSSSIFPHSGARDKYLAFFISNCMQLFQGGITRKETANFAEMINKLLNNRPLQSAQTSADLVANFFQFLTEISCDFCQKSAYENLENIESPVYQEAYMKILDSWAVLLKAESRKEADEPGSKTMTACATCVFDCYFRCHLSAPLGCRSSHHPASVIQMEEIGDESDDKEVYLDVLHSIGVFGRHSVQRTTEILKNAFTHSIAQYESHVEKIASSAHSQTSEILQQFQEDLHWLLLISTHFLTVSEAECIFYVPMEIHPFSSTLSEQGTVNLSASQQFLSDCLTSPVSVSTSNFVDPLVEAMDPFTHEILLLQLEQAKLIGCIIRWSTIERNLMAQGHHCVLSPQVAESTCWSLKRVLSAYCESDERYATPSRSCVLKETFQSGTLMSAMLTDFVLDKFFAVLSHWSSEIQLNKEASLMLICFLETDNKAAEVAKNEKVVHRIKNVDIDGLCPAARKDLLKSIVKICLSTDYNTQSRQLLDSLILAPLQSRFASLLQDVESFNRDKSNKTFNSSDLLNILDCFSGIIQGVGSNTAKCLFNYIVPVLNSSVTLLSFYKSEQSVVDSVLQLFVDVTDKLTNYVGNQSEAEFFYHCVLNMLRSYASNNAIKYVGSVYNLDEDKISDLLLFLQILSNLLSKDVFISLGGGCTVAPQLAIGSSAESSETRFNVATVIITGLETVVPLMTDDFLRYPLVCAKFYKLITNLCQMYTADVCRFSTKMRHDLLQSTKVGLTFEYGVEIVKYSLDFLSALSAFIVLHPDFYNSKEIKSDLIFFIKLVFETCLKAGCEVELLSDASTCLFSLICLNQHSYQLYVEELINSHVEPQSKLILRQSFEKLLLPRHDFSRFFKQNHYRKDKILFRDRFESFLDGIQGVLNV